MKVLRFNQGIPEWTVPLDELSMDMKRVLRIQIKTLIDLLGDVSESASINTIGPQSSQRARVVAMLDRLYSRPA
ncbi:MAG: hypothetical protein K2W95_20745 [Candidatus Obscuribacterales bacterium]|nr:hypothetical protein [Candidatus Obscuribacterales bacterium]